MTGPEAHAAEQGRQWARYSAWAGGRYDPASMPETIREALVSAWGGLSCAMLVAYGRGYYHGYWGREPWR